MVWAKKEYPKGVVGQLPRVTGQDVNKAHWSPGGVD